MATAGYLNNIAVSTDDVTYNVIGGCNANTFPNARAMLDVTEFGDTANDRIAGLFDFSPTAGGHYDASDTAQTAIQSAFLNGTAIYVRSLFDGTNGYKVQCRVSTFELTPELTGTTTFSATFVTIAAPTAVP